ncbi:MAG: helix-turn-helix domain-containing protein [Fibrobacterota bacterium]
MNRCSSIDQNTLKWIGGLVGHFTEDMVKTLQRNVEFYVQPDFAIFIPVAGYCDYAVLPNHSHPSFSFIYHSSTAPDIIFEDKPLCAKQKQNFCYIAPGIPHQEIQKEGFCSYCAIMISPSLIEKTISNHYMHNPWKMKVGFSQAGHEIMHMLNLYMAEFSANMSGRSLLLDAYKTAIIHLCIRSSFGIGDSNFRTGSTIEFNNLVSHLTENLEHKITVKDMARFVSMSPSHFTRKFRQYASASPMEYLNDLRIEKARRLIKNSTLNLTEIALQCGFSSASYFSTRFTEKVCLSPLQYRKKFYP